MVWSLPSKIALSWKGMLLTSFLISPFFLDAQKGPGGIGEIGENSRLALWLRAEEEVKTVEKNGNRQVQQWKDISGSGFAFEQSNSAHQPTLVNGEMNGKPVLQFERGEKDYLKGEKFKALLGAKNYTVFLVAKSAPIGGQVLLSGVEATDNKRGKPGLYIAKPKNSFHPEQKGKSNFRFTHRCPFRLSQNSGTNVYTTHNEGTGQSPKVLSFSRKAEGSEQGIRVNSQDISQKVLANKANKPFTAPLDVTIGTLSDWMNSMNLHGQVAEIIIYREALSQVEQRIVEKYLHKRYNISQPLDNQQEGVPEPVTGLKGIGMEKGNSLQTITTGHLTVKDENYLAGDGYFLMAGYAPLKQPNSFVSLSNYSQISNKAWWIDPDNHTDKADGGEVTFSFSFPKQEPGKVDHYRLITKSGKNDPSGILPVTPEKKGDKLTFTVDMDALKELLSGNRGWLVLGTQNAKEARLPEPLRPGTIAAESSGKMLSN